MRADAISHGIMIPKTKGVKVPAFTPFLLASDK